MLDANEYLHLAVNASMESDHHKAMECLKKCLELDAENANANYLLGAEYAEIGMFDRAVERMEKALELEPGLEFASFQLGMLYLRGESVDNARQQFEALADRATLPSLQSYSRGMLLAMDNDHESASAAIQQGIDEDQDGTALQQSMMQVLKTVRTHLDGGVEEGGEGDKSRVYLGAYSEDD